ncbi:MAG: ATP-binding cassette domain-containing protein [Arenimonas sp.]
MTTKKTKHSEAILSAHGIVNRFGKQVVHDKLDLEVRAGEILGIAGGSGSGKSVLLKTLIGLHRPDSGEVLYNGESIESIGAAEKSALIGVLFQQGALFSSLSVLQNVMLPMREHTDLSVDEQEKLASIKLELAGMSGDNAFKFPSQLSGGMVKRAALARALALDPRILFLDEPTSDLDSLTASGIDELILKLNQGLGITVVIVTHDLNTLFNICDRVAMLVEKKIIVDTADKLMRSDQPWIHELLHSPRAKGALNARKSGHGIG